MLGPDEEVTFELDQVHEIPPGRISLGAIIIALLLGAGMTAGGSFMLAEQVDFRSVFVFVVGIGFFAMLFYALSKQRNGRHGGATLSPEGLGTPATEGKLIPWSEISGVQVMQVRTTNFIGVGLTDRGRSYLNRSKLMNGLAKASEGRMGPGDMTFTQPTFGIPLGMFYTLLLAYASEHSKHDWAKAQLDEAIEISTEAPA